MTINAENCWQTAIALRYTHEWNKHFCPIYYERIVKTRCTHNLQVMILEIKPVPN